MLSDIFIRRPRMAGVISIIMFLAGLIALSAMPVEQYPDIVPPQVSVTANYPGAGADVTEQAVAQPNCSSLPRFHCTTAKSEKGNWRRPSELAWIKPMTARAFFRG